MTTFAKGETIFEQESPSDAFYAITAGRVKIFKMMPNGKDLILEVFGPGDPLGAVAAYMDRPFPGERDGHRGQRRASSFRGRPSSAC